MDIQLICVGKLKERFYQDAAAEYLKRLGAFCKISVTELPEEKLPQDPSPAQIRTALSKEGDAVRQKLPQNAFLVALCIEGKLLSSPQLAQVLETVQQDTAKHLVFLIGGSFGLDETLKSQAQLKLSMSPMTFPHHLARVMLLEQLYRGFQISRGSKYHK